MFFDKYAFYHIKNLQSTKTTVSQGIAASRFYHIKNLQSTKTIYYYRLQWRNFITLRIYKVLKRWDEITHFCLILSH